MATVATLKLVEDANAATAYSIASIPLNKLVPWDGNVRKTGASDGLEELIASIEANGLLQSLVVRKANRGKYFVIAGRRRFLALSALAESEKIAHDAPVPCRVIPGSADPAEISLTENVVRAPMHPADQFLAFSELVEAGSTPAEIAGRFGLSETAVKQRLKLARVSPTVFQAYRDEKLTLEQVQAFTVSEDHSAQDNVLENLSEWNDDADTIRDALTENDIRATDKRARFVTIAAYEDAGGAVRRDLFAEDDEGVFLLDSALLDRLALEKLRAKAEAVKAEGWKWVEIAIDVDRSEMDFRVRRPEPLPLTDEAAAQQKRLTEEYTTLFDSADEHDDELTARLDDLETRIAELDDTVELYSPEVLAIAGALVTIAHDGETDVMRGLVRPEDEPEGERPAKDLKDKVRPAFSASLVESLTACRSAAISASLCERPDIALAAVVYTLSTKVLHTHISGGSLQISLKREYFKGETGGSDALDRAHEEWAERIPAEGEALWLWCLAQERETLLKLLAFCTARSVDAVQRGKDEPDCARLAHATSLARAMSFDMKEWFTPTAQNYFSRVSRTEILSALAEAKGLKPKRSWEKLKKTELAILAEREIARTGWLPEPIRG